MSGETRVKPALTPEQWDAALRGEKWGETDEERTAPQIESMLSYAGDGVGEFDTPHHAAMALANALLPDGDPRKVEWSDVWGLNALAGGAPLRLENVPWARALAAKLAALLWPVP